AAQEMRFVGIALEDHVGAGMIGAVGQINRFDVAGLIPLENIGNVERGDDVAGGIGERDFLALLEGGGQLFGDRQRERNGPGVEFAIVLDDRFVQHAVEGGGIHGPGGRAERAIAPAVNRRKVGIGNRDLRELGSFGLEGGGFVGGDGEIYGFG